MRIISKNTAYLAIGRMLEIKDEMISYIKFDEKIDEDIRPYLIQKVTDIANNVTVLFQFGKLPFLFLNSQKCKYIHVCMTGYADLSNYYCSKPPKLSEISKSMEFVGLSFQDISNMFEIADGIAGFTYFYLRRKNSIRDKRNIEDIYQSLLATDYQSTSLQILSDKFIND